MAENESNQQLTSGEAKAKSRWAWAGGAALLSLLLPGLGQLVNRQPRKALALGVAAETLRVLQMYTHWMLVFWSLMGVLALGLAFQLGAAIDAAYGAAKRKEEAPVPLAKVSYTAIALVILSGLIFPSSQQVIRKSGFGAFLIASGSMCPTLCVGERVVADRNAYQTMEPQRGDVVLLRHDAGKDPFLKRIIGMPGDVVVQGPDGAVLVNGVAFHPPPPCAKPDWKGPTPPDCTMCGDVTVKPGEYFVIGDDLGNSFDSRFTAFGPVTKDMLVGKVLFVAWSKRWSRIGCAVR